MITGKGWHYTYTEATGDDGTKLLVEEWKDLPAGQHPHPLLAAADAPDCCRAAADYQADGTADSAQIKGIHAETGRLYLSPGTFSDGAGS